MLIRHPSSGIMGIDHAQPMSHISIDMIDVWRGRSSGSRFTIGVTFHHQLEFRPTHHRKHISQLNVMTERSSWGTVLITYPSNIVAAESDSSLFPPERIQDVQD